MLSTLQLIAILQGLFLLVVLIFKRKAYKKPALWLLIGAIVSILLFIVGDDDNNLISNHVDWFFFDTSLFITFLFLFVQQYVSESNSFNKRNLLYFIPNILYFLNEISEVSNSVLEEYMLIDIFELAIELCFLTYLILTIRVLLNSKKQQWMLYVIIPLSILISTSIVNDILGWFNFAEIALFSDAAFATYTLVIVAFIFYFISIKLIVSPTDVLLASDKVKYKSSGLNDNLVDEYKGRLIDYMETEKGYANNQLSLTLLSQNLKVPKHYISEILSVHLNTNFQDFVNGYRIEAFIDCILKKQYSNYTLTGIATEVGFSSKSVFYATFKKHKGVTPSEYKKMLVTNHS